MRFKKLALIILCGLLLAACSSGTKESNKENINNKVESNKELDSNNNKIKNTTNNNEMKNVTNNKKEEKVENNNKIDKQQPKENIKSQQNNENIKIEDNKEEIKNQDNKEEAKNEGESNKKDEVEEEKPKSEDEIIVEEALRLFSENGYEDMVFLNKTKLSSTNITGVPVEIENMDIYQFKHNNQIHDKGYFYDNVNKKLLQLDQGLWKIINENNRFTNETYLNLNLSMEGAKALLEENINLNENESIGEVREVQGLDLEKIAAAEVLHNIYEDKVYIVSIINEMAVEDRYAICARTGFIYDVKSNWNIIS